jgi:hypothetical protein
VICRRFGTLCRFHLQRLGVEYWVEYSVLYSVFPRRQIVICRRFGTLCQFHLLHPAFEDGTDRGFRNVGKSQSDAGEIPRRIHRIFKARRKFEIKDFQILRVIFDRCCFQLRLPQISLPLTHWLIDGLELRQIFTQGQYRDVVYSVNNQCRHVYHYVASNLHSWSGCFQQEDAVDHSARVCVDVLRC